MKKRIVAMLLVLAMALSLTPPVAFAATDAEPAEGSYKVGYSKVDINPYADGTGENQALMSLGMAGYGDNTTRLSLAEKLDDNGDGKVDENDGIFVTCTAITDKEGNTALIFAADLLWGYNSNYGPAVMDALLGEEFKEYGLSQDRIFFNGSHNHFAPEMAVDEDTTEAGVQFNQILKTQFVEAARQALADRTWADMYQGSLNVKEYFNTGSNKKQMVGDLLNDMRQAAGSATIDEVTYESRVGADNDVFFTAARHFKITEQKALLDANGNTIADPDSGHTWKVDPNAEPVTFYAGNGFNDDWMGVGYRHTVYKYDEATGVVHDGTNGTEAKIKEIRIVTAWEEATEADDTLRVVQFRFANDSGKEPVALINWRGHLPSNAGIFGKDTNNKNIETPYKTVSGGMVNALRNAMAFSGYRASFLQGETGGINMQFLGEEGRWMTGNTREKCNVFGTELAQLALQVIADSEKINEDGGEIRGIQQVYQTDYVHSTPFEYMAAMRYKVAYTANGKVAIGKRVYTGLSYYVDADGNPLIDTTGQTYTTNASGETVAVGDPVTMASNAAITISSWDEADRRDRNYKHRNNVGEYYNEVALNALTIGNDFALTSVDAEIFDHYIGENGENLWDTLKAEHNNPFILGVTNNPGGGYMPDKNNYGLAASDNEPTYVVGTYESNGTRYAAGTGEAVVEQLDIMLDFLKTEQTQIQTTEDVCQHCGERVTWTDLTQEVADGRLPFERTFRSGHYKLSGETDLTAVQVPDGVEVCIDLNGQNLNVYRNIVIYDGGKLNMFDSQGTGTVMGYEGLRNGGIFTVSDGAELNIYGGTYRYDTQCRRPASGGIVYVGGSFTLYDGTLEGTAVSLAGGAVAVGATGHAFFRGGTVTNGYITTNQPNGNCITTYGAVTLSGDPNIASLFYIGYSGDKDNAQNLDTQQLNIDGVFTGKVSASGVESTDPCIGVASETADVSLGDLYDGSYNYHIEDGKVYKRTGTDYVAKNAETGEFIYGNYADESMPLNTVLQDLPEGSRIVLQKDAPATVRWNINKDLYLELKSKIVSGPITVAEGKTLYVSDVATADYDITDTRYGRTRGYLSGTITGNVVGAPATEDSDVYTKITESNKLYFHAVKLNIDQLVLRADYHGEDGSAQPGVYFKHQFAGDTTMTGLVESYGIAFSLVDAPTAQDLAADATELKDYVYKSGDVVYTQYTVEEFPYGETTATNTSTLITGIMKDTNTLSVNKANASMPIHGTAYIKLTTGEYILGVTRERSLQEQVESIDTVWEKLNQTQRTGVLKMQKNSAFANVVKAWDLTNMTDGAKSQAPEEEKVLRVLSIGNSHTDNATQYLYDVFKAENPDQEVQIAQLYYSGCSVSQHVKFAANNEAVYRYRTQDNRNPSGYSTMKQALQAEVWDVIILHDMNNPTATGDSFTGTNKRNLQKHINYVKNNSLNSDPTLIWNFSWANPTDADLMATTSAGWAERYQNNWDTNYDTMLGCMITNTKQYVMTNDAFSDVAPTGLAFQHVRNSFVAAGNTASEADNLLYCDYTHATDSYGCILASYVWYATITGQTQIDEIKVTKNMTAEELAQLDLMLDGVNYALANKASLLP